MTVIFDYEREIQELLEAHPELKEYSAVLHNLCGKTYDEAVYDCDDYRTHDDKYDDGYSTGFSDGYDAGFSAGYNEGYTRGERRWL